MFKFASSSSLDITLVSSSISFDCKCSSQLANSCFLDKLLIDAPSLEQYTRSGGARCISAFSHPEPSSKQPIASLTLATESIALFITSGRERSLGFGRNSDALSLEFTFSTEC